MALPIIKVIGQGSRSTEVWAHWNARLAVENAERVHCDGALASMLRCMSRLLADFVAEVGCREPRTVVHRARCDAAAGAGDDGAAQTRPGAAVLFVLP